jgi:hypothetical protein
MCDRTRTVFPLSIFYTLEAHCNIQNTQMCQSMTQQFIKLLCYRLTHLCILYMSKHFGMANTVTCLFEQFNPLAPEFSFKF